MLHSDPRFRRAALSLAALALPAALPAQEVLPADHDAHGSAALSVTAVERTAPVVLDGVLDESVWRDAPAATGFRQNDPREGEPATQRTEVRFAFDAQALYVGARMHDSLGAAGVRARLARRDQDAGGDYLELVFDTYHDHSGRTVVSINPSGVKRDAGQASSYADPSWDPVWQAATRVDSLGWTAELRIPLSQLRFPRDSVQRWGVQVTRFVERLNETSSWAFWTKEEAGGPSRYGHLDGLRFASRPRAWELLPYAVTRASYVTPSQPGSPFQSGREYDLRVGADLKGALSSNLTLSATVNPDFGQVEVDPAVVNLSAFETFYDEKRPFFVEGSGVLGFGGLNCFTCSNASGMSLFYSRRIGRRPQGSVPGDAVYSQVPDNTSILGAAKVTGQLGGGWQLGVLDAVTASERARLVMPGGEREHEVEPLTNYLVGRVRRNLPGGNGYVGVMATSVVRRFDSDALALRLPRHAEAAGVDWNVSWHRQAYNLRGSLALSQVSGDSSAILRLQRGSARYFDRPDREHGGNGVFSDRYDPSLEALRGWGGYLRLAKVAGAWQWEAQTNVRSPGFEVNDLAYLSRADEVWTNANLRRRWTRPTAYYRFLSITGGGQRVYNFDGDLTEAQLHGSVYAQLPNYWEGGIYAQVRPTALDDRRTRGGPAVEKPGLRFAVANLSTDARRPVVVGVNAGYGDVDDGGWEGSASLEVRVKPASNLSLSFSPSLSRGYAPAAFVRRWADPTARHFLGHRAVFGELRQTTLSLSTRAAVIFSPTLSLELFAQPFVATGQYARFSEYTAPRTGERRELDAVQLRRDGEEYVLDADRDPTTEELRFRDPDFNLRSLRGNAVLRWEYRPGSTLFFVWQQQRSGHDPDGLFSFRRDVDGIFRGAPDNVFVVKATYWLGR